MSAPSVSIGLPVWNGERYLREALDSILNQTLQDWELIICDNASTDNTEAICRECAARDSRVRYFRNQSNIGASRNFCRVFELAQGCYFKWLAVDDWCAPEFLERCKRVLDESPDTVVCTTKVNLVDQYGQVVERYADRQDMPQVRASDRMMARVHMDAMSNTIYGLMRAETIKRTSMIGDYAASDEVFLAEISLYGRFSEVPEYLLFRRRHPDAYSSNLLPDKIMEFYAPSKNGGRTVMLRILNYVYGYLSAILRAPLSISERFRLLLYILRIVWWHRAELAGEIASVIRGRAGR